MKKAASFLCGIGLFFCVQIGSAFADSALNSTVEELKGSPYKWSGTTEEGFDCSGFTMYVFAKFGIDLPHSSSAQAKHGVEVSKDNLRPGDLVFFNTNGKSISHVGIYLGDGQFIHSATDEGVVVNRLSESYYSQRYVTARRILSEDQYAKIVEQQS